MKTNKISKNDRNIKTIKSIGKIYFIYVLINAVLSAILFMIIAYVGYKSQNMGIEHILFSIPALILIFGGCTYIVFRKFLLQFGVFEKGIEKVANGDYNVKLDTEKTGAFMTVTENFNKMTEELKQTKILNEEFIHNFSHEFKTPISSIYGFSEVLLEEDLSEEERRKYLNIIKRESNRLTGLAEKILFLSKLNTQSIIVDKKMYRLDTQIKECIIMTQKSWEKKNITVNANLREITYNNNPEMIQEIWINLLSNAIKYTNENGSINIKLTKIGKEIIFTISDTGIGIEEEKLQYIFNEYYQADESHHKNGVGLGLSIVKKIVNMANGRIEVESKVNEGTTFTVILEQN